MQNSSETIAAISTTPGPSALAVVRLSGGRAENILREIFSTTLPIESENLNSQVQPIKSHRAKHGYIYDPISKDIIDEVVATFFRGPHSFTGEDLVEISCHGGELICVEILSLLIKQGARLSRRGEFTERAFLNGKIDLTQAESVLDIIQAKTSKQGRLAVSTLAGRLGKPIEAIRSELIKVETRVVAGIDFPEEIGDLPEPELEGVVKSCKKDLLALAQTARSGKFLREGLKLALVGRPNAGKSSLLNLLLRFERAIVTPVPGTTRDSIEEILDLNGIPLTLVDTAGIRHTVDQVEIIGIERSRQAIAEADLLLLVMDMSQGWGEAEDQICQLAGNKDILLIANKWDLLSTHSDQEPPAAPEHLDRMAVSEAIPEKLDTLEVSECFPDRMTTRFVSSIPFSAARAWNLERLSREIENWVYQGCQSRDTPSLNMRQAELCLKAAACLDHVFETLEQGMPQDCVASDLKIAIDALSEVSGIAVSEEIISEVFANFCIGK